MAEKIKFYFDPGCPWCYVTSKWAHRLEELGKVDLSWGIFSLEVQNAEKSDEVTEITGRSAASLRTAVALRDAEGDKAVGKFYKALGARTWDNAESLSELDTLRNALTDIGADPALVDKAMADDSTMRTVIEEHHAATAKHGSFGVPSIVLDAGEGLPFFGPVIKDVPDDDTSVKLLDHVLWLTRYADFYELKRNRTGLPELESIRQRMAARAAQQQQA